MLSAKNIITQTPKVSPAVTDFPKTHPWTEVSESSRVFQPSSESSLLVSSLRANTFVPSGALAGLISQISPAAIQNQSVDPNAETVNQIRAHKIEAKKLALLYHALQVSAQENLALARHCPRGNACRELVTLALSALERVLALREAAARVHKLIEALLSKLGHSEALLANRKSMRSHRAWIKITERFLTSLLECQVSGTYRGNFHEKLN